MKFRNIVVQQMNSTIHSKLWGHFDPRLQKYALTFLKYENSYKIIFLSLIFYKGPRHRPKAILYTQNLRTDSSDKQFCIETLLKVTGVKLTPGYRMKVKYHYFLFNFELK